MTREEWKRRQEVRKLYDDARAQFKRLVLWRRLSRNHRQALSLSVIESNGASITIIDADGVIHRPQGERTRQEIDWRPYLEHIKHELRQFEIDTDWEAYSPDKGGKESDTQRRTDTPEIC